MGTSISAKCSTLLTTILEHGLGETLSHVTYRLHEEFHEHRLGIRTSGLVTEAELGHEAATSLSYSGAPYRALHYCLARIPIRSDTDALLDYGCGMGRAMIVAATKPFKRVVGVEVSAALAERARDNLRRARKHLKCEVHLEVADAQEYAVPDDITVIRLFNPFIGETLARAVRRVHESLQRRPRGLKIIYGNPGHFETMFLGEGWLQRQFVRCFRPGIGYAVYDCPASTGVRRR